MSLEATVDNVIQNTIKHGVKVIVTAKGQFSQNSKFTGLPLTLLVPKVEVVWLLANNSGQIFL